MNKEIIFVTSNSAKFKKVKKWVEELDPSITIEQADIDLPEYQSLDAREVALGKAKLAFEKFKKPLIIDDGGIYLEQYNSFPGPLAKHVFEGIGLEGVWKLAKENPKAYFSVVIIYIDGPDSYQFFEGICYGTMIEPRKGEIIDLKLPYTHIFIPQGYNKTLAELSGTEEEKKCDHRRKAIERLVDWLNKE